MVLFTALLIAVLLGIGIPIALYTPTATGLSLLAAAMGLTIVFIAMALLASVFTRDKAKGIGVALLLSGASQLLGLRQGVPLLGRGALHSLTMGCLGSVLLAMVTRVSSGHSGRGRVLYNLVGAALGT